MKRKIEVLIRELNKLKTEAELNAEYSFDNPLMNDILVNRQKANDYAFFIEQLELILKSEEYSVGGGSINSIG